MSAKATPRRGKKGRCEIVQIALLEPELRALKWLKDHFYTDGPARGITPHCYAVFAVRFAAMHPEEMRAWLKQALRYCAAEGLSPHDYASAQILAHPTYRRERARA